MKRTKIHFRGEDDLQLRGWLYTPDSSEPVPAITMAHGFAATCAHGLDAFARSFANAGFTVLMHDHRGFGASAGQPRHDVDPWKQIADWRHAISFLESHPSVDGTRIGLWGSSFAGGHALVLGATDRRLKAIVAQVPTVSGYQQSQRRISPGDLTDVEQAWAEDDRRRFAGQPAATLRVVSVEGDHPAVYRSPDAYAFYTTLDSPHDWDNVVTARSSRAARMYEPGQWAARVSPTPLLMIVALADTVTLTDTGLAAYQHALPPKKLETISGGHFDPYKRHFRQASSAARDWFIEHLGLHDEPVASRH